MAFKPFSYNWQWQLKSKPEDIWLYIADTHRLNQALGTPVMRITENPLETGGSRLMVKASKYGVPVAWEEMPFDWVKEQWYTSVRVYHQGPLKETAVHVSLEAKNGGTLCKVDIKVIPANILGWLGIPYQIGWEWKHGYERVVRQIDEAIQNPQTPPFKLKKTPLGPTAQATMAHLSAQLIEQGQPPALVESLVHLLSNEADTNLSRMRPYVIADSWNAPRRAVLELFLSAAKISMLNMRWDLMCPLCRGDKFTAMSLDEVRKGAHCPTCNIDFEADFSQNIELTFTPHPQIRPITDNAYCTGGPMVTPHILVHQTVQAGQTHRTEIHLEPGRYRLRTQKPGVYNWLDFSRTKGAEKGQLTITITPDSIEANGFAGAGKVYLSINNTAPYKQRFYLERAEWYTGAVTAAEVTALQHFRDLFSDEALRPGEEISVQGMTILFSDLVGSTAMYNTIGDAPSYALVREQFAFLQRIVRENNGAIVKTIGDAIMAAFLNPADGVATALAIQKEVAQFNQAHPDNPLTIKLGMHHGPCIAVTLNGRLDYFGTTVNLAARLEGQSKGNDVIISEQVRNHPAVEALLASKPLSITLFGTPIKGFEQEFLLYQLKWQA